MEPALSYLPRVLGIKLELLCLCLNGLNGLSLLTGSRHVIIESFEQCLACAQDLLKAMGYTAPGYAVYFMGVML